MTKKKSRLLAAIMFTDMVGYTALMQKDEQKAKANRDRHRKILQNSVAAHGGKILQYYGDGTWTGQSLYGICMLFGFRTEKDYNNFCRRRGSDVDFTISFLFIYNLPLVS